jgi:hypothetical protein
MLLLVCSSLCLNCMRINSDYLQRWPTESTTALSAFSKLLLITKRGLAAVAWGFFT